MIGGVIITQETVLKGRSIRKVEKPLIYTPAFSPRAIYKLVGILEVKCVKGHPLLQGGVSLDIRDKNSHSLGCVHPPLLAESETYVQ